MGQDPDAFVMKSAAYGNHYPASGWIAIIQNVLRLPESNMWTLGDN